MNNWVHSDLLSYVSGAETVCYGGL